MTLSELLEALAREGITLEAAGDRLAVTAAPGRPIPPDLRAQLLAHKPALLALLREPREPAGEPWPALVPRPDERHEPFPMTELQQAYSVGRSGELALGAAMHAYNELDCPDLDLARFERAWNALVERHEMLRAVALPEFQQRILAHVPRTTIPVEDLRDHDADAIDGRLRTIRRRLAHQRLDLARWPLFELRACLLPGGRTRLFMSVDGTFVDGYSFQILYRELVALYRGHALEPATFTISFRDYALAAHALRGGERHRRALAYWRERLPELPPAPDLPLVCDPADLVRPEFGRRAARLEPEPWARLVARARARGLTAPELLLAAYADIIARWSRSPRFCLNVPHFGRLPLHPQITDIVGTFASFTLVAVDHRPERSFTARARALRLTLLEALSHREVSGVELLRELFRAQGRIAGAIMPVVLTSFATQAGGKTSHWVDFLAREFGELTCALTQTPQVWIDHQVVYQDGGVFLNWDVADALFPAGMIDAMFSAYLALLERLADRSDETAWDTPWLDTLPDDQRALLARLADNARPIRDRRLHHGFERHALARPDAPALATWDLTLGYGELARRAHRLARALQGRGAGPGSVVAVVMEKGWEQVVAVLGIHAAGAAYLPVDADLPDARRDFLIADAGAALVVTQPHLRARAGPDALVLTPDAFADLDDAPLPDTPCDDDALAAILYTSGSTGQPNGVRLGHRGLVNGVEWTLRTFGLGEDDRLIALSALHHDFSVFDIFGTLAAGGTIVLPDAAHRRDPARWAALMEREGVTIWSTVPAMMEMLLSWQATRGRRLAAPLRLAMLGGDWIPVTMPARLRREFPDVDVVSVGGPTETSLWNIAHRVEPGDAQRPSIPYGTPIANTRYLVLDERLDERPVWVAGELCCAGVGVAWGYVGDRAPDKFTVHPASGARIYRTGDLGRRLPNGVIEFLGRVDFQLSIRGQRIEPGEVEAALVQAPGIAAAVVGAHGEHHERRLVAWVVPHRRERGVDVPAVKAHLRGRLPAHMVPDALVVLESLPLTRNAKVDRRALPPPDASASSRAPAAPTATTSDLADLRTTIAATLAEILGLPAVDPERNFFDDGANSIHLVRLAAALEKRLGVPVPVVELFTHPRAADLARRLAGADDPPAVPPPSSPPAAASTDIAVVGMSCRLPGAASPEQFWANLLAGVESIASFDDATLLAHGVDPAALTDPAYVRASATLADHDRFDNELFGLSPRDARALDPQQRVFLECVWEALERAGHRPDPRDRDGRGRRVGVFAGKSVSHYRYPYPDLTRPIDFFQDLVAQDKDFLATQVSYLFNFGGPSVNVATACSTSLVAVVLACDALLRGDCDLALAGGVAIKVPHAVGYRHEVGSVFSGDGHCRPFDAAADGTVPGSGAGVVALARLERARAEGLPVLAVLKGGAINNDGRDKVGFMAPGARGQTDVLRAAHRRAGVDPSTISYVEAHGTGTALGDAIELAALRQAFGPDLPPRSCALGAVKGNLGHLDSAAGVAGLIKTVLALQHGVLPATVHFRDPKPELRHDPGPFWVVGDTQPWPRTTGPRRAGVSSFGIGGTNAHVVLEEAPPPPPASPATAPPRPFHVLALAAQGPAALRDLARRHREHLEHASTPAQHDLDPVLTHRDTEHPRADLHDADPALTVDREPHATPALDLADHCHATNLDRAALPHRLALVAADTAAAIDLLRAAEQGADHPALVRGPDHPGAPRVAFLFSGQGSQQVHDARAVLATEPRFRDRLADLDRRLRDGWPDTWSAPSLLDVLYPAPGQASPLDDIARAQPCLFALQVALAEQWLAWGVAPDLLVGHSTGELAAAHLAGVFSLEDGLRLAVARGRALAEHAPPGAALAVFASEADITDLLRGLPHTIAAYNGPQNHVLSGAPAEVDALEAVLRRAGLEHRRLRIPRAPHCALMEPALPALRAAAERVRFSAPRRALVSGMTGARIDADIAAPDYWCRQLREPVRFGKAIATLAAEGASVLIEIGPKSTLLGMAAATHPDARMIPSLRDDDGGAPSLYLGLAAAFAAGLDVDWAAFDHDRGRRRVPVPTYPFQRRRFWRDDAGLQRPGDLAPRPTPSTIHPLLGRRLAVAALPAGTQLFEHAIGPSAHPFLGDHRIFGAAVLPATGFVELALAAGRAALGAPRPHLRDLEILRALELPDDRPRTIQTVARPTDEPDTFAVDILARPDDDGAWQLHARARVTARKPVEPREPNHSPGDPATTEPNLATLPARPDHSPDATPVATARAELSPADLATLRDLSPDDPATPVATARAELSPADLATLRARAERELSPDDPATFHAAADAAGIGFGPSFRLLGALWRGPDEILARIEPPPPPAPDLWIAHPALLDACLQPVGALALGRGAADLWVPLAVDAIDLGDPPRDPPTALWSHVRITAADADRIHADVNVLTDTGERWLAVRGLRLGRVSAGTLAAPVDARWIHERRWEPVALPPTRPTRPGGCLILADRGGLGRRLADLLTARGWTCLVRDPDADFAALRTDLERLDALPGPHDVVHLRSLDAHVTDPRDPERAGADPHDLPRERAPDGADLLAAARPVLEDTLDLLGALARRGRPCGVWLVTAGAAALAPGPAGPAALLGAPLWGLARAAGLESPELDLRCLDLDPTAGPATLSALADELERRPEHDDDQIVLRPPPRRPAPAPHALAPSEHPPRHTAAPHALAPSEHPPQHTAAPHALATSEHPPRPTAAPHALATSEHPPRPTAAPHALATSEHAPAPSPDHDPSPLRLVARLRPVTPTDLARDPAPIAGRTHVIAGAFGRLGLRVAELLAAHDPAALVLLGRRPPDPTLTPRLDRLRARGVRLIETVADLADADALDRALAITADLPPLGVLLHCAGELDDGVVARQTWDRFATPLRPALAGAWNLHRWSAARPHERLVLFASSAGLLGSAGQSNHAAASTFLDALAWHRRARGLPATVIDWGIWAGDAGARVDVAERARTPGFLVLPEAPALRSLERLLAGGPTQVAVAAIDWAALAGGRPRASWRHLLADVPEAPRSAPEPARGDLRRRLAAAPDERRRVLLQTWLSEQVAWMLGADDPGGLDPQRGFHELGIDSLASLKLRGRIQAGLDRALPGTALFSFPSIAALAARLADVELADLFPRAPDPTPTDPAPDPTLDVLDDDALADLLERQLAAMEGRT